MKIFIYQLKENEKIEFAQNLNSEEVGLESYKHLKYNTIRCEGTIQRLKNRFLLKCSISTVLDVECARCLTPFRYSLNTELVHIYEKKMEITDSQVEADTTYFYDNFINLDKKIRDSILVSIPLKFLCKKDCKGICPNCRVNLNFEECKCDKVPEKGKENFQKLSITINHKNHE